MKTYRALLFICLAGVACLLAATGTRADEVLNGAGELSIQGGAGCTPAPCLQTIHFSITMLVSADAASFFTPTEQFLSSSVTGSGPLGSGGSVFYGQDDFSGPGFDEFEAYLTPSAGDEIDLLFSLTQNGADFTLSSPTTFFNSCTSANCVKAFIPPAFQALGECTTAFGCESADAAAVNVVSFTDGPAQVPEPAAGELLGEALAALLMAGIVTSAFRYRAGVDAAHF
jgi:hypothetical protein